MGTKTYDSATDLITFSRASGGTALRKVSYGPELVTNGTFDTDTTGWVNGAGSTTTFIQTGGVIQITASGGNARVNTQSAITLEVGKTYTFTAECTQKDAESGSFIHLGITSGVAEIKSSIGLNEPAGVYSHTFVATNSSLFIQLGAKTTTASVSYDNISVKEVTFDQADGTLELFNHPDDVPRIEYDAAGAVKGLLIEEARTNLLKYSEDFSNNAWFQNNIVVSANEDAAPDGSMTADLVSGDSASDFIFRTQVTPTVPAGVITVSMFLKYADHRYVTIGSGTTSWGTMIGSTFDLLNGTVSDAGTATASSMVDVGNGWFQATITVTTTANPHVFIKGGDTGTFSTGSYTPTTSSGFYIWGAQVEQGSFPTSYIPTAGVSKTRAADLASIPTSAFGYNAEGGTVVCDFNMSFGGATFPRAWELGSTLNGNERIVNSATSSNGNLAASLYTASVQEAFKTTSSGNTTPLGPVKTAFAWRENDVAAVQDGGTVLTDGTATITGGNPRTVLALGKAAPASANHLNGHIKSIQYYPRRLTNAQLQELTT